MNISSQQFTETYNKLPYPIREYIAGEELSTAVEQLGHKYGLHIDTLGALQREVTNMLLGFENPAQFVGELKSIGVPAENISLLVPDLNEKVFMPLHKKMQEASNTVDPRDEQREVLESLGDNDQPVTLGMPNTQTSPQFVPTIASPAPVFTQPPVYVAPAPPFTPPSISQYAANAAFPATFAPSPQPQATPAQQPFAPVPQPSVSSFPQPTPAVASQSPQNISAQVSPVAATQVFTPAPTQAPTNTNRDALHDILKQYGVDPYRESPE